METELPLELLLTHTRAELDAAVVAAVGTGRAPLVFKGQHWQLTAAVYRDAFAAGPRPLVAQPQLLERLAVDSRPRAVELVRDRRGHRALRRRPTTRPSTSGRR